MSTMDPETRLRAEGLVPGGWGTADPAAVTAAGVVTATLTGIAARRPGREA